MRSIDELAAEICTLTGHINAASHRWLMLIAEFDRRNGWSDSATQSCAHWLNWKCGIAMGAAREKVRVAPGAREPAEGLRCDGVREAELFQSAGDHAHRKLRDRGLPADDRRARHRAARRETRSCVSPLPGRGGVVARGPPAAEPQRELSVRRRRLARPDLPAAGGSRCADHESARPAPWRTFQLERHRSRFPSAPAAQTPSPWWPRASWRTMPWKRPAPTGSRSSCMWPRRPCETGRQAAANLSTALRWPRKRPGGCPATPASSL